MSIAFSPTQISKPEVIVGNWGGHKIGRVADWPPARKAGGSPGTKTGDEATMAEVVARFGGDYRAKYGSRMPLAQLDALDAILNCRTGEYGGKLLQCECPELEYVYNSCNNRSCPKCSGAKNQQWLEARKAELLPVPYFHGVVTTPAEFRKLIRKHQRKAYGLLIRAVAMALKEIAADPQYLGGRIALLCVLHTWARNLIYHVHTHFMMPALWVDGSGQWHSIDPSWLLPERLLAHRVRKKFEELLEREAPEIDLPESIFDTKWVVHIEPAAGGAENVAQYLGRYIHRVALSDYRILSVSNTHVIFKYRDADRTGWLTMRLSGEEFLRRFLQHVLPKGLHKVRYYGLWSPSYKKTMGEIREQITAQNDEHADSTKTPTTDTEAAPIPQWRICKRCGAEKRVIAQYFPPRHHAAPHPP